MHETLSRLEYGDKQTGFDEIQPYKDFGRGFYLSPNYNRQALERAKQTTVLLQNGAPIVSVFEWDRQEAENTRMNIKLFEDYNSNGPNLS